MAYNFPPKQDLLVSGTNLKRINGVSLLGPGDANAIYDAGSDFAINFANGATQTLLISGSVPTVTLSNPTIGAFYMLRIEQGSSPIDTINWPHEVFWGDVGAPRLSNATGEVDLISLFYDGSKYWGVAQIQDALPAANNALTNLSFSSSGTVGQVLTLQSGGPAWAAAASSTSFPLLGSLGAANAPTYSFSGDPDTGMWSSGANTLNFSTAGTERVRITDSGNVGIGTTSPAFKLDIRAGSSAGVGVEPVVQSICGTGGSSGHLALRAQAWGNTSGNPDGGGHISLGGSTRGDEYKDAILFITDKQHRMVINQAGNVGIGINTPSQKLEVIGNISVNKEGSYIAIDAGGETRLGLMKVSGTRPQIVGKDNIILSTCPNHFTNDLGGIKTERLRVDSNGNVKVPNYILSPQVYNNGAYSSGTVIIDWAQSPVQTIVVQGNITLTFINQVKGGAYALRIRQDGTGGTITWPSDVSWPGDTAPTLSIPGNMDIINFLYFADLGKYLATSALNFPFTLTGDTDAANFILNAGISDETQQDAIRILVANLKAGLNVWSKLAVIYPFVGETASTQKYNLKDTAAYQLTFSGTWDHNSIGAKNTGSGAYADTGFLANQLTPTDFAFGLYTSEDSGVGVGYPYPMGLMHPSESSGFALSIDPALSRYVYFALNNGQGPAVIPSQSIFKGFFTASFRASDDKEFYRGSTSLNNTTTNVTPNPFTANPVFLGGMNDLSNNLHFYSPTRFAFAYIASSGLTSAEVVALNSAVQQFQITLGRAV